MNNQDFKQTVVDTSANSTTLSTRPTILTGVYVNTALSAHTVVIKNGATAAYTLPASLAAGTYLALGGIAGVTLDAGLVIDPDDSSTGSITVEYKVL